MKRIMLFALLLAAPLPAGQAFNQEHYMHFINLLEGFDRELWGCPSKGVITAAQCNPNLGIFDAKQWAAVSAEGKELFK